ncbi:hypothetical protein P2R12_05565 [Cytobacillus oceanisediminis]|uniref:hypothetical protein n=1 Tax=Cytobacillus oceanisediminis TaxID=665099 RepID=UPI0023DC8C73|nr:hypothetical protein [Cytobacillus oceanisediminis]MDF2036461.1 hypothetical protein [Cytobacillus oceanisediminis]
MLGENAGDIRDEFYEDEVPEILKLNDNHSILDSKLLIGDVNNLLGTNFENIDVNSFGGWPQNMDAEIEQKLIFEVHSEDLHQPHYLEVIII